MIITPGNYYSNEACREYCGYTQYKDFMKCEAAAMAELNSGIRKPPTDCMMIGSYVDAYFSGELKRFQEENHDTIYNIKGKMYADFELAEKIIARTTRDKKFREFMLGEPQAIRTGTIAGVPFKIKMDSYHPGKYIVDLKVVKDMQPIWDDEYGCRRDFIHYWGYDKQAAIYQTIEGNKLPFILCVATKEKTTDIAIIQIPQTWIDSALIEIQNNAPRIEMIKRGDDEPVRCDRCDYCKETKQITRIMSADELMEVE